MIVRRILERLRRSVWMWPLAYLVSFTIVGLVLQFATGLPLTEYLFFIGLFLILRGAFFLIYLGVMFLPFWLIPLTIWIGYRVLSNQKKTKTRKESSAEKPSAKRIESEPQQL